MSCLSTDLKVNGVCIVEPMIVYNRHFQSFTAMVIYRPFPILVYIEVNSNTIANTINYTEKYITNQEQQSTLSQD